MGYSAGDWYQPVHMKHKGHSARKGKKQHERSLEKSKKRVAKNKFFHWPKDRKVMLSVLFLFALFAVLIIFVISYDLFKEAEGATNGLTGKWLGSRQKRCNWATKGSGSIDDKQISDNQNAVVLTDGTPEGQENANEEAPENNSAYTTVYVSNLSHEVTQAELHYQFHALGAGIPEEVHVQRDKSFGFVRYNSHEEAAAAIRMANGKIVHGKPKKVYYLQGGILKYHEEVPKSESQWEDECFVFDKQVAVEDGMAQGTYMLCYGCKQPVSHADIEAPQWEYGVSFPHCYSSKSEEDKDKARARHRQFETWGIIGGHD